MGISAKRLQANTNRTLASLRKQILGLFGPWMEIDNSVEGGVDELLVAFDRFEERIQHSVEWLKLSEEEEPE